MQTIAAAESMRRVRAVGLLMVLSGALAVLLFWRIGDYPLTDGDAAYYARVARTIVETGEVGVLRFDPLSQVSDVDKPPLVMWVTAAMFRGFGATDTVARAWHAVVSLLVLGVTAVLAARVAGRRTAGLAVVMLLTTVLFFYQAREPLLDMPLTLCVTGALALVTDHRRLPSIPRLCTAAGLIGLGVMTKGPIALVLVVMPAAVVFFASRPALRPPAAMIVGRAAAALAVVAAVAVPWHAWIYVTQGGEFFDMFAGTMSWRRYLNPVHVPGVPLLVYTVFGLGVLFPWSGLAIPALRAVWRERHEQRARFFLGAYVVCGVAFFGLSPGMIFAKYLLPLLPACATLIAWHVGRQTPEDRAVASWTTVGVGTALIPAAASLKMAELGQAGSEAAVVVALLGATAIVGGVVWRRPTAGRGCAILAGGAAATYVVLLAIALPRVLALYPERALAGIVNGHDDAAGAGRRVSTGRRRGHVRVLPACPPYRAPP